MKKDFRLGLEQLDRLLLLSANPWYVDSLKAPEVWSQITSSNSKPVVAIVDSGIDLSHDEFKNNLWNNPYDKLDGIDNDKNGYIDDINGWDFVQNDNSPQDGLFHGTHVAGIISKISNGNVNIMPLRFQNDSGLGYAGAAASAIHYAVDMKIKGINIVAINCSFGGLDFMPGVLDSAIRRANDSGIMVIMAAGNNGVDMDQIPKYPASIKLTNSLTVAAINSDLSLAGYSNYGKKVVDVGAPGSNIYSSLPNNTYGYVSGSSMAAPMASATAGLLKTLGNYSAYQIKNAILQGCEVVVDWADKVGGGFVNILRSWNILSSQKPEITNVVETQPTPVVIAPSVPIFNYGFSEISSRAVKGWARLSDGTKPIVEIRINNKLRYVGRVSSSETGNNVSVIIDKRWLRYGNNQIEIKIKDPMGRIASAITKKTIRR